MEKNKKIWVVFSIAILTIFSIFLISAKPLKNSNNHIIIQEADVTPPTIYGVWASPTEVEDGDYVTIYVNASDDLSGINGIDMWFKNNLSSQTLWIGMNGINFSTTPKVKTIQLYIPPYSANSTWYLNSWYVTDNIGNSNNIGDLWLPMFNVTSSFFYIQCPYDFGKVKTFKNRTINESISPDGNGKLDFFTIDISHFTKQINYTLNFVKDGEIRNSFSKINTDKIEETWYGNWSNGNIEEGSYDILINISNEEGNKEFSLGQINVDRTPTDYKLNVSSYNLNYDEDLTNENNVTINFNSEEVVYFNVSFYYEDNQIQNYQFKNINTSSLAFWFNGKGCFEYNLESSEERYFENLPVNKSYLEDVCAESSGGGSGGGVWIPHNIYCFQIVNNTNLTINLEGYDSFGNNIEEKNLNITLYTDSDSGGGLGGENITCYQDSDCGNDFWTGNNYCFLDGNVWGNYVENICRNPRTNISYCAQLITTALNQTCSNGCSSGVCNPPNSSGSNSSCYQESATIPNQTGIDGNCGLNYSGSYGWNGDWMTDKYSNIFKAFDGNWNNDAQVILSVGAPNLSANHGEYYVNYTKPANAESSSKLKIRIGYFPNEDNKNLTIPLNCFNQDVLQFKFESIDYYASGQTNVSCYNGSSFEFFYAGKWSQNSNQIREEAMIWDVNSTNSSGGEGDGGSGFSPIVPTTKIPSPITTQPVKIPITNPPQKTPIKTAKTSSTAKKTTPKTLPTTISPPITIPETKPQQPQIIYLNGPKRDKSVIKLN